MIGRLTRDARRREMRAQARLMIALEASMARSLAREFARVAGIAAREYEHDQQIELNVLMAGHRQMLLTTYRRQYRIAMRAFADRVVDAAPKPKALLRIAQRLLRKEAKLEAAIDQEIQDFIREHAGTRVVKVSDTTRNRIMDAIADGTQEEMTPGQIARLIRQRTSGLIGTARAQVIARTETHSAAMAGSTAAAEALELPGMKKTWTSGSDERVREDHADADGQTVPMDDYFDVGGEQLMYPGDPSGSAENIINCRCVLTYQAA